MRNYELIKKIWAIVNMRSPSSSTKVTAIENLIKEHRPELKKRNKRQILEKLPKNFTIIYYVFGVAIQFKQFYRLHILKKQNQRITNQAI